MLENVTLTKRQMIDRGASGVLSHAYEKMIPLSNQQGWDLTPADWTSDDGKIHKFKKGGKISKSIEVIYDFDDDLYYLQDGNHRVTQGLMNGDSHIKAFVQPDKNGNS